MSQPQFPDPLGRRELNRPGATSHKAGLALEERVKALEAGAAGRPGPGVSNGSVITSDTTQTGGVKWQAKPTYIAPTFSGTWANYDAAATGWAQAGYYKDFSGTVHLGGLVARSGTTGGVIFNLPAGYRPAEDHIYTCYAVIGGANWYRVDIQASGDVVVAGLPASAVGYLSLSQGMSFIAA